MRGRDACGADRREGDPRHVAALGVCKGCGYDIHIPSSMKKTEEMHVFAK
jgi:hypothetical protein